MLTNVLKLPTSSLLNCWKNTNDTLGSIWGKGWYIDPCGAGAGGGIRNNIIFTINNVYKKHDFVYIPSVCKKHDFV